MKIITQNIDLIDFYGPFSTYNVKVIKNIKRRYKEIVGKSYTGTFFENIELVTDEDGEDGEN